MMASVRSWFASLVLLVGVQAGLGQSTGAPPIVIPTDVERAEASGAALPRWFCTLEAASVWAWFGDAMSPSLSADLPKDIGQSVSPQTALGVRFESGSALLVNFRYLSTCTKPSHDRDHENDECDDLLHHTNLTGHWLDFDYQSASLVSGPFALQWQTGLRVAHLSYDVKEQSISPWSSNEDTLRTDFWGAGPHIALLPRLNFGATGLSLFGLADLGFEIGGATFKTEYQTVSQTPGFGLPVTHSDDFTLKELQIMADLRTEAGISYTSPFTGLRFDSGYRFAASVWGSRVFSDHGPFVRVGLGF